MTQASFRIYSKMQMKLVKYTQMSCGLVRALLHPNYVWACLKCCWELFSAEKAARCGASTFLWSVFSFDKGDDTNVSDSNLQADY